MVTGNGSLTLWSKLAFGHRKWFRNTNLFQYQNVPYTNQVWLYIVVTKLKNATKWYAKTNVFWNDIKTVWNKSSMQHDQIILWKVRTISTLRLSRHYYCAWYVFLRDRRYDLWSSRVYRITNYSNSVPQWYKLWFCECLLSDLLTFI